MAPRSTFTDELAARICERRLCAIYALRNDAGEIRYIGKAINPEKRFQQHISTMKSPRRARTPLYNWMRAQAKAGRQIEMSVLEWVDGAKWQEAEKRLIAEHRCTGRLLNIQEGGDQPMRSADPNRQRMWWLKKQLRIGLKQGLVTEQTKQKLRAAARRHPAILGEFASI